MEAFLYIPIASQNQQRFIGRKLRIGRDHGVELVVLFGRQQIDVVPFAHVQFDNCLSCP